MESSLTSSSENAWDKAKLLSRSFYRRNTLVVAQELLGKVIIVRSRGGNSIVVGRIVETEGYHGSDPASHSARGQTPRSAIMFGEPGVAYIYFIYGMYEMLNFVTERKGYPGAVLIRALEPLAGLDLIKKRRKNLPQIQWTNGPGRLCQALGLKLTDNGQSLEGPRISVWDDGYRPRKISRSPRVGISQAKDHPWRFFITGNSFVSQAPQNALAKEVQR